MPVAIAAALFVAIWSTGFIVARAAVAHADPQLFLALRMAATAAVLALIALPRRDRWPSGRALAAQLAIGALLPGAYLCLSWWSVGHGMPAGIMSLLGALQPLPIALAAPLLFGERLRGRAIGGILIGLAGTVMVLAPVLGRGGGPASAWPAILGIVAIMAMAAATLAQQRLAGAGALTTITAAQNLGGTLVGLLAWVTVGSDRWDGSGVLWLSFLWSIAGLSIAGLGLLAWLVRREGATRVSTLLLLVPALAAIEAWAAFGERLLPVQLAGFALALGGVMIAGRPAPPREIA